MTKNRASDILHKFLQKLVGGVEGVGGEVPSGNMGEITALLQQEAGEDPARLERLTALLYPELRRLAQRHIHRESADHTLQATELISEFYLSLLRNPDFQYRNRDHFLFAASRAMRHLLVDHARAKRAAKRGGNMKREDEDKLDLVPAEPHFDALDLEDLLNRLEQEDARMARIIELRFFGGLTNSEIAGLLSVHERTVRRDLKMARAWLRARLTDGVPPPPEPPPGEESGDDG